jgi:predicted alpha-1,2-mannosidase
MITPIGIRLQCSSLAICCLLLSACASSAQTSPLTPAELVNPMIGTAKGGNVFPGADFPFGMLQWSPDDSPKPGGYDYSEKIIGGFSLTHFSGRGHEGWQDFPFMPTTEVIDKSPGSIWAHYAASFTHNHEKASAGYYSVLLDNGIKVELTSTLHGGAGRFTFPANAPLSTILVNAGGSRMGDGNDTTISVVDNQTLAGMASSRITTIKYKVYFAARFDRAFQTGGTWNDASLAPGQTTNKGSRSGAYLTFNTASGPVEVKVAISFVSAENALANLTSELASKNFDQVYTAARSAWNSYFEKIRIEDGNTTNKIVFYTSYYHSLLHPNIFSDVNGQYLGFDKHIHQLGPDSAQYENISSWDGWRNQFPLFALVAPIQARDIVRSLIRDAQQDPGGGMPRWEQDNQNSGGMVGDSPAIYVADAYAYDVRDFDANAALGILVKDATDPNVTSGGLPVREQLADYLKKGFVSAQTPFSASIVLEYSNDDFAISRLAAALGKTDVATTFLKQAQNWKNLYDPHLGYVVPKSDDGTFLKDYKLSTDSGFKEGTPQQYTWMVPFNFKGLFDLMGGEKAAVEKLQHLFTQLKGPSHSGEFANMGNEPGNTSPWAYDFAGAPYLTQKTTREIVTQLYTNAPDGLPGNDDGGAMSSWCVFASLGIFPEIPGVAGFVVGSPLFKEATITLPSGALMKIHAPANSDHAVYVQGLLNGQQPYNSPWIPWDIVKSGAEFSFIMSTKPNTSWGADAANAPPSFDSK